MSAQPYTTAVSRLITNAVFVGYASIIVKAKDFPLTTSALQGFWFSPIPAAVHGGLDLAELDRLGLDAGRVRKPLPDLTNEERAGIRAALRDLGYQVAKA